MTKDKENEYKQALADSLVVFAVLMIKLQKLGDAPTEEENLIVGATIDKVGKLIAPDFEGSVQ